MLSQFGESKHIEMQNFLLAYEDQRYVELLLFILEPQKAKFRN